MNYFGRTLVSTASLIQRRSFKTSSCLNLFWERDEKGGYDTKIPLPPFKERMKIGMEELKKEIALWKQEVKEFYEQDPCLIFRENEVDVVWKFDGEKSLEKWNTTCDRDHNEGFSSCSLTTNKEGKALFSGEIITRVPRDGRVKRAGYCNMKSHIARKSFKRETHLNWTPYNMLVMRIRGDGRNYLLNIHTKGTFDVTWNDIYNYVLYTRGGPYWQIARIPFSKFFLSNKGRVQDIQPPIPLNKISAFGITAGIYPGSFSLEIDYIGLEFDPNHSEDFAYEMYEQPSYLVST